MSNSRLSKCLNFQILESTKRHKVPKRGPIGRRLKVGARRFPKLLVNVYLANIKIIDNCGRPQCVFATVFGLIKVSGKFGNRMLHPHAWFLCVDAYYPSTMRCNHTGHKRVWFLLNVSLARAFSYFSPE